MTVETKSPFTWVEIYVEDMSRAQKFYETVLGVEMTPMQLPAEIGDLEMIIFPWAESLIRLIKAGMFGCGVLTCHDIFATYEELKAKGVEFIKAPTKEFYGTEAMFKDDSGNYFSLQPINNFDNENI